MRERTAGGSPAARSTRSAGGTPVEGGSPTKAVVTTGAQVVCNGGGHCGEGGCGRGEADGGGDYRPRTGHRPRHNKTPTTTTTKTPADTLSRKVEIIKRPGQTLGFYIREGNGLERLDGVFISRIAPGSVVESNSLLRVADEITSVNGVDVTTTSLDDVVILMSIARRLVLHVRTRHAVATRSKNASCPSLCSIEQQPAPAPTPVVVLKHTYTGPCSLPAAVSVPVSRANKAPCSRSVSTPAELEDERTATPLDRRQGGRQTAGTPLQSVDGRLQHSAHTMPRSSRPAPPPCSDRQRTPYVPIEYFSDCDARYPERGRRQGRQPAPSPTMSHAEWAARRPPAQHPASPDSEGTWTACDARRHVIRSTAPRLCNSLPHIEGGDGRDGPGDGRGDCVHREQTTRATDPGLRRAGKPRHDGDICCHPVFDGVIINNNKT